MEKTVEKEALDLSQNPELIENLVEGLSEDDRFMLVLNLLKNTNGYHFSEKLEGSIDNFFVKHNLDLPSLEKLNLLYQKQIESYQTTQNFQYTMKSFEKWNYADLKKHFGIVETENSKILEAWLDVENLVIAETEQLLLEKKRAVLKKNVKRWNEEELKLFFISHILELVDYEKLDTYRSFAERKLSADLMNNDGEEINISGNVDFLVANGELYPEQPFFCIHEYKKEKGVAGDNDPLGQLLVAMYTAQELNEKKFPMYGAYVMGRHWYFVVLENKEYAVSRSYDASEEGIFEIYKILNKLKTLIEIKAKA